MRISMGLSRVSPGVGRLRARRADGPHRRLPYGGSQVPGAVHAFLLPFCRAVVYKTNAW